MFRRAGRGIGLFLLLILLGTGSAWGQAITGKAVGTVTDSSGAVVAGAAVKVQNQETGVVYAHRTDSRGDFTVPALPPGTYTITIESAGFSKGVSRDIVVRVDQAVRVDFSLKPGSVAEAVEVKATAPLVASTSSEIGEVIEKKQIQTLPLNGRLFSQLVTLTPGAVANGYADEPENASGAGARAATSASVNGLPFSGTTYTIDGVANGEPLSSYISMSPPVEAIQEFKVQTNNPSAEFGSFGGAIVNLTMRSGTNEFHGSLFNYFRNNALNAKRYLFVDDDPDYLDLPLRSNQFGGTFGGPIKKNKLFFFGDYQGLRLRQGRRYKLRVPSLAWRHGDFSDIYDAEDPSTWIYDPVTHTPFAGNIIPTERMDPATRQVAGLYPVPNADSYYNFQTANSQLNDANQFDIKVDYQLSQGSLFFRESMARRVLRSPSPGNQWMNAGDDSVNSDSSNHNAVIGYLRPFGTNFLNEFRIGFNRFNVAHYGDDAGVDKNNELGIPNGNLAGFSQTSGIAMFGFDDSGFVGTGSPYWTGAVRISNTYNILDNMSWIKGAHTFKFGVDYKRVEATLTNPELNPRGEFWFNAGATSNDWEGGNDFASFLLGTPYWAGRGVFISRPGVRMHNLGLYFQDDFRVTRNLTINYGLRWDLFTRPTERANRQANFSLNDYHMHVASSEDPGPNVDNYYKNFAPRVGIAYSPDNGRTAIRGAFGISYFQDNWGATGGTLEKNYPFLLSFTNELGDYTNPTMSVSRDGLPGLVVPEPASKNAYVLPSGTDVFIIPKDFKQDMAMMWNFGIQRQLTESGMIEASYVGTRGRRLFRNLAINTPLPGPGDDWNLNRPYWDVLPGIYNITLRTSDGKSAYDSLQIKFTKRLSKGLQGLVSYTWSKSLDNLSVFYPYDDGLNRGLSTNKNTDMPQNLVMSFNYELPIGPGKWLFSGNQSRFAKRFVEGWNISGIASLHSGAPLVITTNGYGELNNGMRNRADLTCEDVQMPKTVDRWFDTSCFGRANDPSHTDYRFGNSGKGSVRGPGWVNFDMSVAKVTKLSETKALEFRADFFNFTNTPHFSNPGTRFAESGWYNYTFGRIMSTAASQREVQLGLKFTF